MRSKLSPGADWEYRIAWSGRATGESISMLRQSRCFVSAFLRPKDWGFQQVEAMAVGVPVIATPARGVVDFIPR